MIIIIMIRTQKKVTVIVIISGTIMKTKPIIIKINQGNKDR